MELILGPPGTGKTTALLEAVERALDRGTPPERMGYVSFTRRAAEEAVTRACDKFKLDRKRLPYFRTLHSLCFAALGLRSDDVLQKFLPDLSAYLGVEIKGRWSQDGTFSGYELGDRVLMMYGLAQARCISLREQFERETDDLSWPRVEQIGRGIDLFKKDRGLVDYNDMLSQFVAQGRVPALDFLAVDEAQDQTRLQWHVAHALAQNCPQVLVAGDDDQAIFRWAGADVDYLIDLEGDARVLGQSWRVPLNIQALAHHIIAQVQHRRPKQWRPRDGDLGRVERVRYVSEADLSGQVLVLARNLYVLTEQVVPHLRYQGVFYEQDGHPSIPHRFQVAIMTWEALRRGEMVAGSEARDVYQQMSMNKGFQRGHKLLPNFHDEQQVSMTDLEARGGLITRAPWFEALDRLPPSDVRYIRHALQRGERLRERPRVRISTIHGSKGGEADHVILMKEMATRTFREMALNVEDEARVWYVGVTRARRQITLVESMTNQACPWL